MHSFPVTYPPSHNRVRFFFFFIIIIIIIIDVVVLISLFLRRAFGEGECRRSKWSAYMRLYQQKQCEHKKNPKKNPLLCSFAFRVGVLEACWGGSFSLSFYSFGDHHFYRRSHISFFQHNLLCSIIKSCKNRLKIEVGWRKKGFHNRLTVTEPRDGEWRGGRKSRGRPLTITSARSLDRVFLPQRQAPVEQAATGTTTTGRTTTRLR